MPQQLSAVAGQLAHALQRRELQQHLGDVLGQCQPRQAAVDAQVGAHHGGQRAGEVQVVAAHHDALAAQGRSQVHGQLQARRQALLALLVKGQQEVVAQRLHRRVGENLLDMAVQLAPGGAQCPRVAAELDHGLGNGPGVTRQHRLQVFEGRPPHGADVHRVAPVDQVQLLGVGHQDIARVQVAVELLVDHQVGDHGVQEGAAHLALRAGGAALAAAAESAVDAGRRVDEFHFDDAPGAVINLRHVPLPGQARAPGKARLVARLRLEIELFPEALHKYVHLFQPGGQEGREFGVWRPVLAAEDGQLDHCLADQELAFQVVAAHLDHYRGEDFQTAFVGGGFLGQVDRGDGAGFDGSGGVEAEVALGGQLTVALQEGLLHFPGGHGFDVFLEHGQRLADLVGQEIGTGRRHLGHLDEEGAELAHHAGDDVRLFREILGIGGEKLANIAQRADLAAEDHQILADDPGIAQYLPHLPVVAAPQFLHLVDQLGKQRLVGRQEDTQYVQADLTEAAQLGLAHQLVEELPEFLGDLGGDGHHAARGDLVHQEAQQVLGALLVGQQIAAAHAGGEGAQLQDDGMLLQGQEQLVQCQVQFLFAYFAAAVDELDHGHERAVDFCHSHREVAGAAHQPTGLGFQSRQDVFQLQVFVKCGRFDLLRQQRLPARLRLQAGIEMECQEKNLVSRLPGHCGLRLTLAFSPIHRVPTRAGWWLK